MNGVVVVSLASWSIRCTEQLREQRGQGAKFHPTQPPVGPVGSWDGLEVVQGVQLGHRATWFGGGRARPAPAPAPLPPPRTSGWRPASKAVRLFSPPAFSADASTCPGSACYTRFNFRTSRDWKTLPNSAHFISSPQSFLERASGKGHSTALSCGISYSEATT